MTSRRIVVIGPGRLGRAIAPALASAGVATIGPLGRDETHVWSAGDVALLCVRDEQIASAAAAIPPHVVVGHTAGALTLAILGDRDAFSLHPLLSVTADSTSFAGAACAISGRSDEAVSLARELATRLQMDAILVQDEDRALYHAAASLASNYLVTLEAAAGRLAASVGVDRRHVGRLAASALENWIRLGEAALTGPIVRGDEATVARQRAAVVRAEPQLERLWDAMSDATRALVR
jgi:predicted short-subunit dehydrogenase-like oxidoreductase (DUF2520 family)